MAVANSYSLSLDSILPNVLHYWDVFRRAKWSILGWTLIFALVGVGFAVNTINVYEATVIVAPAQRDNRLRSQDIPGSLLGGLGSRLLEDLAGSPARNSQQALRTLKSRDFLTRFVERRQLLRKMFKPVAFARDASERKALQQDALRDIPAFQLTARKLLGTYGRFKRRIYGKVEELTQKLYKPVAFDRDRDDRDRDDRDRDDRDRDDRNRDDRNRDDRNRDDRKIRRNSVPTLEDAQRKIKRRIAIERRPREGLIRVKVRWEDPVFAAEWANALIEDLNSALRETAITDARKRIAYLNRELDKTSVIPLRQSIYRLIESEVRSIMFAETRIDYALKVIDSAVPSEPDQPIRPNRSNIIWTTALTGFGIGAFWAVWRDSIRMLRGLVEESRAAR